ncbi:MAG: potassium transporter Kup [Bacteroidetes bacterium]|nr:potassium transporter Kup [Bacteroidota bacterium]
MPASKNGNRVKQKLTDHKKKKLLYLSLLAIGIVYGDIGTSPLYAIRECFHGPHGIETTPDNIFGILSLVFWSLILVISIKYLLIIFKADHNGEGGILALMEFVRPKKKGLRLGIISALGIFGAALLYGDGVITPVISVLSAIEGLEVATPLFSPFIIPITIIILLGLFLFQKKGTSLVGSVFGPVTVVWFLTLAVLGISVIIRRPEILLAINPYYAIHFFIMHGTHGLIVLGVVFLVVTGGEALYADIGHFGKAPIRLAWFTLVLPSLVINYFGQGALLLENPELASNPFYLMAPSWALYPLVVLATMATIIASQAVISGAFSLTFQAIQLGYLPRFVVKHTSDEERGQIFIPKINTMLMVGTILIVLGFKTSSNLAAAYGLAVTMTMAITSLLAFIAMHKIWKWGLLVSTLVTLLFLSIDLSFLGSNLAKIASGGWLPLSVGILGLSMMLTWKKGRRYLSIQLKKITRPIQAIVADFQSDKYPHVPGTAIYMTSNPKSVPPSLSLNLKHNKIFHEQILILSINFLQIPRANPEHRIHIENLAPGFFVITANYGFMESVDVSTLIEELKKNEALKINTKDITYVLGHKTLIASRSVGMNIWQDKIYLFMSKNSQKATAYFKVPQKNVFEIGTQVSI